MDEEGSRSSRTIENAKAIHKSATDDIQKSIDDLKSGEKPRGFSIAERTEEIDKLANSTTGYSRLVLREGSKAMKKLSILTQEYQQAVKNNNYDFSKYNTFEALVALRDLLEINRASVKKINGIVGNWRKFLEDEIPESPEITPSNGFDQRAYTAARLQVIDGSSKAVTQASLSYYNTEEEIWNTLIEKTNFLISGFAEYKIDADGGMVFEKESDLEKFNALQVRLRQAGNRSVMLLQEIVNERRNKEK